MAKYPTEISKSLLPWVIVLISSGNGLVPLPVPSVNITKSNKPGSNKANFKCTLDLFPDELFTEMFISDGRSGRYEVEIYAGYTENNNLYIDRSGKKEIDINKVNELKKDINLRFYGLVDSPSLSLSENGNFVEFDVSDLTYYLSQLKITKVYTNTKAIDVIKDIVNKFNIDFLKISNNISSPDVVMGQRASKKEDKTIRYVCRNQNAWQIIQDCASKLGEQVYILDKSIVIGFDHPYVNDFEYRYGSNVRSFNMVRNPKQSDEDVYVEVIGYDAENNNKFIGSAGKYTSSLFDTVVNANKNASKSDGGSDNKKTQSITTKIYRFYDTTLKSNNEAKQKAKRILNNILYKTWKGSLSVIGNPFIQPDDRITINRNDKLNWADLDKIKWYVEGISEEIGLDGYTTDLTLYGVAEDAIFDTLSVENDYVELTSDRQFLQPVTTSNGSTTGTSGSVDSSKVYTDAGEKFDVIIDGQNTSDNKLNTEFLSKYRVTSNYGNRTHPTKGGIRFHAGIDLGTPQGTPLKVQSSLGNGTVTRVSKGNSGYGYSVDIKHENGYTTRYAHLSDISVKPGQTVKVGEIFAKTGGAKGSTGAGTSTGPHLHFEVRNRSGNTINPLIYDTFIKKENDE